MECEILEKVSESRYIDCMRNTPALAFVLINLLICTVNRGNPSRYGLPVGGVACEWLVPQSGALVLV